MRNTSGNDYEKIVLNYCEDVLTGKIIAGELQKLSIKRYFSDLEHGKERGIYFDKPSAIHAIKFFSFLKHSKGEFAGQSFELLPWQMFCNWNIFGWKIEENTKKNQNNDPRRFNYSYIEVARKNGKSTFAAGNGLYMMDADGEPAAEVYCFATKEDQAKKTIFTEAKNMVIKSPILNSRIKCYMKSIFNESTLSFFQPLGSDSDTQDGLNTHGGINDEYHAHKDDGMMNVIKSSMGARRSPHIMTITTAGINLESACYRERDTCVKILKGILEQDNKFVMIFTLDEDQKGETKDDWQDENLWFKSNPSMNAIPTLKKFLKNEYIDAINNPSRVTNFKTKNLNIWCNSQISYISDEDWMKCNHYPVKLEDLKGRPCHVGIDLAKRVDINSMVCIFKDRIPYDVFCMFWIPSAKLSNNPDDVDYQNWYSQGLISVIEGQSIDMEKEADEMYSILSQFDVQSIGIDTAYLEFGVGPKLTDRGLTLTAFRQGFISMGPPVNELEALVMNQELNHGGNPVLRWMNSNVVIAVDPAGNRKIHKGKSKKKVDGMVSLVMAVGEMMGNNETEDINEYYQKRMQK